MTSAFSWQNSISLCPASFRIPRPYLPVTPGGILGISELKWTPVGEINSDDHCIYYCGQESLRRSGIAIMVNKRV